MRLKSSKETVSGGGAAGAASSGGKLMRLAGKLRDQPRRAGFGGLVLLGKAEVDLRRGGQNAAGDGFGQLPIELRSGVGHSRLALNLDGQQRMRRAARGPGVLIGSQEPDGVGGEAGRLGGTGDLDGRVARLGSEKSLVQCAVPVARENPSNSMRRPSKPSEPQLSTA
jgi:hypothetical protein